MQKNKHKILDNLKKKISVIIPCYNEAKTIKKIINRISLTNLNLEIIIVDDYSIDGSRNIIKNIKNKHIKKKIFHKKNMGKGACIKSSIKYITGEIVLIQDADLEYNPRDYKKLLQPFQNESISVVYGSRVLNKKRYSLEKDLPTNFRVFSNHVLTLLSNFINFQLLTDAHTCYKLFKSKLFFKLKPSENDFAFCPEVTTKISNLKIKIHEVPISYNGRGYDEGKKIGIYDAIRVVLVLMKYKFLKK